MTQPNVPHGYADWNRVSAQVDTVLLDVSGVATPFAGISYDLGYVGNFPAIGFNFGATVTIHQFRLEFFADAAFTQPMTSHMFGVAAAGSARRIVTVLGPYLRLRMAPTAAGGTHTARVFSASRSGVPLGSTSIDNVLISVTGQFVFAGLTDTQNTFRTWPGDAHWTVTGDAATWRALLQVVDEFGTVSTISSAEGVANQTVSQRVFLPASPVRVAYTNTSAGNADYDTYVVGRPIESGA